MQPDVMDGVLVKRTMPRLAFVLLALALFVPLAHAGSRFPRTEAQKQAEKTWKKYNKQQFKMQKRQMKEQKKAMKRWKKQHQGTSTTVI